MEREKEDRRRTEQVEEKRQQREDKFREDITNTLGGFREELEKSSRKPSEESSVEEIPIDADGKPTTPDKAVSVKKIYRGSGGLPREDPLDTMIKMEELKQKMIPKDKGEDPEIRDLKTQMHDNEQKRLEGEKEHQRQVEDLRNKIAEDEKARAKEQLDKLDSKMENMRVEMRDAVERAGAAGINSLEGGVGKSINTLVNKSLVKDGGQVLKEILNPGMMLPPGQAPAVAQATTGTPSGVVAALRDRGLVTTIRERVGGPRL
jgi:hypothetical protein